MVRVDAPARLHLGQLDLNGSLGRIYGGLGLALEGVRLVLRAERADQLIVEGREKERVESVARRFLDRAGLDGGVRLSLEESIPPHVGLGSGTQLALSVTLAISRLYGLDYQVEDLARFSLRGHQSGVGIGLFRHGGFLVDGGIPRELYHARAEGFVPPVIFHSFFPPEWLVVTVIPGEQQGVSGRQEVRAFSAMPPIPPEDVGLVCRLLVMQLLPSLLEKNLEAFGQALTEIQWIIGKQFASVQGGLYSHPMAEKIVRVLLSSGAVGAGQSSWGPLIYALVEGEHRARNLAENLRQYLERKALPVEVGIHRVRNYGARVLTESGVS